MKILAICAIGAGVLAAQDATTATAPPARGHMGPGRNHMPQDPQKMFEAHLTSALSLTAEQQNKVHTVLEERKVIAKGSREQMQTLQTSMTAAIKAGNEGQIDALSEQMSALHQKELSLHGKTMSKIYASLTPTQQAKVGTNLELLMGHPGQGEFHRGPGGPPKPGAAAPAAQ